MSIPTPTFLFIREKDIDRVFDLARQWDQLFAADASKELIFTDMQLKFGQFACFFWSHLPWDWEDPGFSAQKFIASLEEMGVQSYMYHPYFVKNKKGEYEEAPLNGTGSLKQCRWFLGAFGLHRDFF